MRDNNDTDHLPSCLQALCLGGAEHCAVHVVWIRRLKCVSFVSLSQIKFCTLYRWLKWSWQLLWRTLCEFC